MEPSYASGTSSTPLLGDTIGDNLDRTIERFPDREALVSVHQDLRYTYAQFGEAVDRCARAFIAAGIEPGDRVGIWSPNCAEWALVQYGTAKAGIILVNINPAYRTSELEYVLRQSGCRMLVAATAFKTSDYVQMVADVRDNLVGLEQVVFIGRDWEEFIAGGERVTRRGAERAPGRDPVRRPDQHPVHERHHGLPQGRDAQPPQHPQQRLLRRPRLPLQRSRTGSASRCPTTTASAWSWATWRAPSHGACMVIPNGAFDPVMTLQAVQDERCTSLYGVPTMFIAELEHPEFGEFDLSSLRTGIMAGSPCPIETMRRVVERDAHGGGHDLLRHDRDLAGVDADRRRRPAREARRDRRARAPARRGQDRRPRERRDRRPRRAGRALHARLQRDARLLGGAGEDRRRDRPRPLDAHRRPRADGRRGLHQDRRPHQGHGHPRRRERLPARDRGVPDGPPGRARTSRSSACPIPSTARS